MLRWVQESALQLGLAEIGQHYGRYRLHLPEAERAMSKSLQRYGQLSPVVVCRREDRYELIDGFKRLGAARGLKEMQRLAARLMEADERTAKAAIYGLNRAGGRTRELEEAWIIQALVREDGLSQVEVAELLGRHKRHSRIQIPDFGCKVRAKLVSQAAKHKSPNQVHLSNRPRAILLTQPRLPADCVANSKGPLVAEHATTTRLTRQYSY